MKGADSRVDGVRGDYVHQSDFQGSRRGDSLRGYEKFQRSSLPDHARQPLRASPSGHEPEGGAAMSEDGVGRGDSAVTSQREIKPSTHAMPFDRRNDRCQIAGDCVHKALTEERKLKRFGAAQNGDFIQIGADRKKLAVPRDD